jgi:hypothetical protein
MTSGRWDRSSPSLSTLCGHPRHCRTTPGTMATSRCCWSARGQDVAMTATVPRTGLPSMAPSKRPTTASRQPTTTPPPSKTLLHKHRTHHDAPIGEGFARTAVNSVALLTMLPHVREIVQHACKLLPPWPIKGGAVPRPRGHGTTDSDHPHALRLPHDIGTCLNQYLWDLEARPPLPPCL